jgi:hypothetical protein
MSLRIPEKFAAKVRSFPESSYGATTVTLILRDGRRIENVVLSGSDIVKVGDELVSEAGDLDFSPGEIANVVLRGSRSTGRLLLEAFRRLWKSR